MNSRQHINYKKTLRFSINFIFLFFLLLILPVSISAQENRILKVRGDFEYPPFEYLNDKGEAAGFNIDIFKAVAKAMGLEYKISLDKWQTVRQEIEQGEADVLLGMYKSEEREKTVDFSIPHFISTYAVFVRKGSEITSLKDTATKKVGVQQDDIGYDYLVENSITERIYTETTIQKVLEGLVEDKTDCALISRLQGLMLIKNETIDDIEPVGAPILQRNYCFAVTKGNTSLLSTLNEGLSITKTSGEYDEIYAKWFGVYESLDYGRIFNYVLLFTIPFLIIILFIVLWNWSLKKKVDKRTEDLRKSHENYRITLNSIGDGVISTDINGKIVDMNPVAVDMTGCDYITAKDVDLQEVLNLINGHTKEPLEIPILKVKKFGKSIGFTNNTILRSKTGDEYRIAYNCAPIKNINDEITGFVLVFRNITEEYRQREALKNNEERLRTLSNNLPDGYIYQIETGADGTKRIFTYLSEGAEKFHHLSVEDIIRDSSLLYSQIHPEDLNRLTQIESEAIKFKSKISTEIRFQMPDGEIKWMLLSASPRLLSNNKIIWDGIVIDMNRQKKMEGELKAAKESAEQSNRIKTEFLNNMSHELRTPLNGILGFSKLLQDTKLDKSQQEFTDIIITSGRHLLSLIKDILDFTKIESGKVELHLEKTDLTELIDHSINIFKHKTQKKGVIIKKKLSEDIPEFIFTDPLALKQVLFNLLDNAVKFTEKGKIEISVTRESIEDEGNKTKLFFLIKDTGIGIKKENIKKITTAFTQEDSSVTRQYGGTGLGLAITSKLLKKMDSSLKIESAKNSGSTFSFALELPYEKKDEERF